jgi:hypothetical protein
MPEMLYPGLTIAPDAGPPPQIAQGRNAPIGALASDAGVNAAYQALMQAINNADMDRGNFQRQLTDKLTQSKQDRAKALMMGNQGLADRGILNSGAALQQQQDIGTQWDQYDTGLRDFTDSQLTGIDRGITGLEGGYQTAQLDASGRWTAGQAAAADAAIKHQQSLDAINAQTAQLMSIIQPQLDPQMAAAASAPQQSYSSPMYNPQAQAAAKPKVAIKQTTPSGTTGHLVQARISGPQ